MESEIHIVIIWEKGLNKFDHILYDLKNSFQIIDIKRIEWSEDFFSNNLSRFYGENLPNGSFKERHCGTGPFISLIIKQDNPIYEKRKTSKGVCLVNSQLFDKKQLYRNWTGGGHKIHTSNNLDEARHDIFLLFNKEVKEYYLKTGNEEIEDYNKNIEGFNGWINFNHFFNFINQNSNYLILRNYDNLESMNSSGLDIDFLTSDRNFHYHINGIKKHQNKNRVAYKIKIGNKEYDTDIRAVDDGYYDSKWSLDMLENKILYNNNFFIPNPLDAFYSLLYHILIHKNQLNNKYDDRLIKLSNDIDLNFDSSVWDDRNKISDILSHFLDKNQYKITNPNDFSVQYNQNNKGVKRIIWEMIGKIKNA